MQSLKGGKAWKDVPQDAKKAALGKLVNYVDDDELDHVRQNHIDRLVSLEKSLPTPKETAAAALAGNVKRGWYQNASEALFHLYGPDEAPRFIALLAATSPVTAPGPNLRKALGVWNWFHSQRIKRNVFNPTEEEVRSWMNEAKTNLSKSVNKKTGERSLTWEPSVTGPTVVFDSHDASMARALTADPDKLVSDNFLGTFDTPKIDSFRRNLLSALGRAYQRAVTNDTWIANFGGRKTGEEIGGKSGPNIANYVAHTVRLRRAVDLLNSELRPGEQEWTPAEVQETVWSFQRSLARHMGVRVLQEMPGTKVYRAPAGMVKRYSEDALARLTDGEIHTTPDYLNLLAHDVELQHLIGSFSPAVLDAAGVPQGLGKRLEALGETYRSGPRSRAATPGRVSAAGNQNLLAAAARRAFRGADSFASGRHKLARGSRPVRYERLPAELLQAHDALNAIHRQFGADARRLSQAGGVPGDFATRYLQALQAKAQELGIYRLAGGANLLQRHMAHVNTVAQKAGFKSPLARPTYATQGQPTNVLIQDPSGAGRTYNVAVKDPRVAQRLTSAPSGSRVSFKPGVLRPVSEAGKRANLPVTHTGLRPVATKLRRDDRPVRYTSHTFGKPHRPLDTVLGATHALKGIQADPENLANHEALAAYLERAGHPLAELVRQHIARVHQARTNYGLVPATPAFTASPNEAAFGSGGRVMRENQPNTELARHGVSVMASRSNRPGLPLWLAVSLHTPGTALGPNSDVDPYNANWRRGSVTTYTGHLSAEDADRILTSLNTPQARRTRRALRTYQTGPTAHDRAFHLAVAHEAGNRQRLLQQHPPAFDPGHAAETPSERAARLVRESLTSTFDEPEQYSRSDETGDFPLNPGDVTPTYSYPGRHKNPGDISTPHVLSSQPLPPLKPLAPGKLRPGPQQYHLTKSASKAAVGKNIATEEAAGKPRKQAVAIALHTQDAAKKAKYAATTFGSPNVDEGLTLEQAVQRLRSRNQRVLRDVSDDIYRKLGVRHFKVHDAIGAWQDGAENSLVHVLHDPVDDDTAKYAAAWFGLLANQKAVLHFREDREGPDSLYQFRLPSTNLADVHSALLSAGVPYHTLLPGHAGTTVMVYDQGRALRPAVAQLAGQYHADVHESTGRGTTIGDGSDSPTRSAARAAYRSVIDAYERSRSPAAGPVPQRDPEPEPSAAGSAPARYARPGRRVKYDHDPFLKSITAQVKRPAQRRNATLVYADMLEEAGHPLGAFFREVAQKPTMRDTGLEFSGKPFMAPDREINTYVRQPPRFRADPNGRWTLILYPANDHEALVHVTRRLPRGGVLVASLRTTHDRARSLVGSAVGHEDVDVHDPKGVLRGDSAAAPKTDEPTRYAAAQAPAGGAVARGLTYRGGKFLPADALKPAAPQAPQPPTTAIRPPPAPPTPKPVSLAEEYANMRAGVFPPTPTDEVAQLRAAVQKMGGMGRAQLTARGRTLLRKLGTLLTQQQSSRAQLSRQKARPAPGRTRHPAPRAR